MKDATHTEPEDDWDDDAPEDDDLDFDCGVGDDGLCQYAGSEWCDFECPFRDLEWTSAPKWTCDEVGNWFQEQRRFARKGSGYIETPALLSTVAQGAVTHGDRN